MNHDLSSFIKYLNNDPNLCLELKKNLLTCFIQHNSCQKCFTNENCQLLYNYNYLDEVMTDEEILDDDYPYRYISQKILNLVNYLYDKIS